MHKRMSPHGDFDHMGDAIYLVNNFKVEKVIFNCGEFNDLEQELIQALDKKKIKYYSRIKELNIDNNKLYFLQTKEYDNENDNEYWHARELMEVLEYKEWRKFNKVIQKTMEACGGSNYYTLDHFVLKDKMVSISSSTMRKIQDYKLSKYACYLIVRNCNPRIKIIALSQTYFAI